MKAIASCGLLGRRGAAGADRPDRLVGDHDLGEVGSASTLGEVGLELALEHRLGLVRRRAASSVSPTQRIGSSPAASAAGDLARQRLVGLAEELAALGVAEDDRLDAELDQHRRRDLAGEGARSSSCMFWAATLTAVPRAALDHRGRAP